MFKCYLRKKKKKGSRTLFALFAELHDTGVGGKLREEADSHRENPGGSVGSREVEDMKCMG